MYSLKLRNNSKQYDKTVHLSFLLSHKFTNISALNIGIYTISILKLPYHKQKTIAVNNSF